MRTVSRAAAAAVLGVLCTPAGPALADNSAQQTIDELQSQGYTVTIDKIGTGPLSDCVVTSVRNPQQNTQLLPLVGPVLGGGDDNVLFPVTSRFINVSLHCG